LHHSRTRKEERAEVLHLIDKYQLNDRVLLNTILPIDDYWGDKELNELYNICSVGINTSMGEGWGLVSFEHAATGMAQIVPDHSACGELWKDCGLVIPATNPYEFMLCNSRMREVKPEDVALALEKLYVDKPFREHIATKGKEMVHHPDFQWDTIQNKWLALFNEVLLSTNY